MSKMKKIIKIHETPDSLEEMLNTEPFSMAFSIVCAILIWFTISVTAYKTTHVTFYNIPVSYDLSGTLAEANGLSTVSCDVETVTVEVEGNRSQIGRLSADHLTAYLQIGNISTQGEFTFDIDVRSDMDISFSAANITPDYATVRLDKIETRSYDVTTAIPNIQATDGHVLNRDDVVCEPSVIEITGPSAQLNEIANVEIYSDKSVRIDSLYSLYTNEVRLYTEEGALMDTDHLEIPSTNFQISIPVLTQKTLALTYDIRNAPTGFALNWLRDRLHLSEETINLASQTNTVFADRDSWSVGFITLDSITLDFTKDFEIDVKDEYINQSPFQYVTLTLDSEGLASREFYLTSDNISIVNAPTGYQCDVITQSFPITVVGDAQALEQLSTQDILVTVDLLNYSVQQNMTGSPDATISFTPRDEYTTEDGLVKFWAINSYRVSIYFTELPKETAPETSEAIEVTIPETTE